MPESNIANELDPFTFHVISVKYLDSGAPYLLFDVAFLEKLVIHDVEVHRRHDGFLEVELPYRESLLNFSKAPSISFINSTTLKCLRIFLDAWLKENLVFEKILVSDLESIETIKR